MDSGGSSESTTTPTVPPELSSLYWGTGQNVLNLQNAMAGQAGDFISKQPLQIAPLSATQQLGINLVPQIGETPEQEQWAFDTVQAAPGVAGTVPTMTSEELLASPTIQAQQAAFEAITQPTIENEMALQGLSRGGATGNELAMAEASMLTPLMQEEIARQERGIEREAGAMQTSAQTAGALGAQQTGRTQAEQEAAMSAGGVERDVTQATNDAEYQDMLRRQALYEASLFTPLGGFVPSTIGQTTMTDTSK